MFNLAFTMALLPARLTWRTLRLLWRHRSLAGRFTRRLRAWRSMAIPLGRAASVPVPRLVDADGVPIPLAAAGAPSGVAEPAAPATDSAAAEDALPELARFHSREGDGFKLIFHFQLKKQRVRRTVWLDFTRLARRMGREQAWAMRTRLGHAQMRYAVDQPQRPWGRLELPEVRLAVDSTRGQKARSFMLETLDAVNALIDEGGLALVSGRHQSLPMGDGPAPGVLEAGRRKSRQAASTAAVLPADPAPALAPAAAQGELALESTGPAAAASVSVASGAGAAESPEEAARAGLPRGVVAQHVCTGFLAAAGWTERSDASGRSYRIFYADVDVDGRLHRQTGVDLERALHDAQARIGLKVRLQHLGYVPVNGGRHRRKVWQATVLPG